MNKAARFRDFTQVFCAPGAYYPFAKADGFLCRSLLALKFNTIDFGVGEKMFMC